VSNRSQERRRGLLRSAGGAHETAMLTRAIAQRLVTAVRPAC
jgi:hypothetical protein